MKTALTTTVVATLTAVMIFGIQKGLRSLMSVPLVHVPSDSVVYDSEGRLDVSQSVIMGIKKSDGSWTRSVEWPSLLKGRYETVTVSPEWVPPYVADPTLLTSK